MNRQILFSGRNKKKDFKRLSPGIFFTQHNKVVNLANSVLDGLHQAILLGTMLCVFCVCMHECICVIFVKHPFSKLLYFCPEFRS